MRRDLDAALQLLTDRAQYITGASGAAIALKRNGMNDMLCRASTGENAPELGALLSTEYGLSGESVRTRQALRCDDAEQDARVNREVCRQLGIASVVVMPVVHDDEVLGVFELFSGKANAFGERDLSAVQRLTEMVQTAVRLATAAETLPETVSVKDAAETGSVQASEKVAVEEDILAEDILEIETVEADHPAVSMQRPTPDSDQIVAAPEVRSEAEEPGTAITKSTGEVGTVTVAPIAAMAVPTIVPEVVALVAESATATALPEAAAVPVPQIESQEPPAANPKVEQAVVAPGLEAPKKKLFWSAALDLAAEGTKAADEDQSHVPPVLRGLRKCEACGFPVSAGRVLCVECEEKRWRGQLRKPAVSGNVRAAGTATAVAERAAMPSSARIAAPTVVAPNPVLPTNDDAKKTSEVGRDAVQASPEKPAAKEPDLVLSAGVAPRQSWISSHKYILLALLVAAAVVVIFLSR